MGGGELVVCGHWFHSLAILLNHQRYFQDLNVQGTSQTHHIRISEIPIQMSVFLKLPERFYCATKIENYCSTKLSNENLNFRAHSDNGKERRDM